VSIDLTYHFGMCGRITLTVDAAEISKWLSVIPGGLFGKRYNIAPTQGVPVVRINTDSRKREVVSLRWGLVPSWASESSIGNKMINARSEGVFEKRSFRSAIRMRRCVVPASGFYEWKRGSRERFPFLFQLKNGNPFVLAGLWERNEKVPE
jgi:putative SOS response-associated peptidase YedK